MSGIQTFVASVIVRYLILSAQAETTFIISFLDSRRRVVTLENRILAFRPYKGKLKGTVVRCGFFIIPSYYFDPYTAKKKVSDIQARDVKIANLYYSVFDEFSSKSLLGVYCTSEIDAKPFIMFLAYSPAKWDGMEHENYRMLLFL